MINSEGFKPTLLQLIELDTNKFNGNKVIYNPNFFNIKICN